MYSSTCPAKCGLAAAALLPSAPWQAIQTVSAIIFPFAGSAFALASEEAWVTKLVARRIAIAAVRIIFELLVRVFVGALAGTEATNLLFYISSAAIRQFCRVFYASVPEGGLPDDRRQ